MRKPLHVGLLPSPQGVILYRYHKRYDHANGQPFYFRTEEDALETDIDETLIEASEADEDEETDE